MEDLSHWDSTTEFTADEAAALIAGVDPANPAAALYKAAPTLRLLKEGHRIARAFVTASPVTPDAFRLLRAHPSWAPALMSVLFDCYPMLHKEPWPGDPDRPFELPRRFAGRDGDFEKQRFDRAEIHRWLGVMRLSSQYQFMRPHVTVPQTTPTALAENAAPVADGVAIAAPTRQLITPDALSSSEMAFCFADLYNRDEQQWMKALGKSKSTKWLAACVHTPGVQGRGHPDTMWNPVELGAALVRNRHAKLHSVRARFQTKPALKPWFDLWNEREVEWFATE